MQLVQALLQDVPVFYNSVVTHIAYNRQGATVTTQDGVFQGGPWMALHGCMMRRGPPSVHAPCPAH